MKFEFFECSQHWNLEKIWFTPKNDENLKILAVSRKKVFVPEIKIKIFDI